MATHMFQRYSLSSCAPPPTSFLTCVGQSVSLCLHLHSCPANRFINEGEQGESHNKTIHPSPLFSHDQIMNSLVSPIFHTPVPPLPSHRWPQDIASFHLRMLQTQLLLHSALWDLAYWVCLHPLGCHNNIAQTGWLTVEKKFTSKTPEAGKSKIKAPADAVSGGDTLSGPAHYNLQAGGARQPSGASDSTRVPILFMRVEPSWPNHPLQVIASYEGLRFQQHMNLVGGRVGT